MPSVGFEPTISAVEQPQTYALDRATTGNSRRRTLVVIIKGTSSPSNCHLFTAQKQNLGAQNIEGYSEV
jgi:hypothetical protein